jgi:Arc/MetJ family transcription regulator
MKTTVDIDAALLEQAKRILKTRTIRDTVGRSFEVVIQRDALERLANAAGTVDLDLTARALRRQRRKRTVRAPR